MLIFNHNPLDGRNHESSWVVGPLFCYQTNRNTHSSFHRNHVTTYGVNIVFLEGKCDQALMLHRMEVLSTQLSLYGLGCLSTRSLSLCTTSWDITFMPLPLSMIKCKDLPGVSLKYGRCWYVTSHLRLVLLSFDRLVLGRSRKEAARTLPIFPQDLWFHRRHQYPTLCPLLQL